MSDPVDPPLPEGVGPAGPMRRYTLSEILPDPLPEDSAFAGLLAKAFTRPPKVGELLFGRFELRAQLGEGGSGVVFEALDRYLGREVAVKLLRGRLGSTEDARRRFERESRLLAKLDAPGIVAAYDFLVDDDRDLQALVMQRIYGMSLRSALDRSRFVLERDRGRSHPVANDGDVMREVVERSGQVPDSSALLDAAWFRSGARVVSEVLRTLHEAHEIGVIHRDLTPRNIMLTTTGRPVVLDFGLATALDAQHGTITESTVVGTPGYSAPEQIASGKTGADRRTDVYQVGLLLYEWLTLRRAFERRPTESEQALLFRASRGDFALPREHNSTIPPDLESICLRAIELQPRRRYQTAAAFALDLERWLVGLTPGASSSGSVGRTLRDLRFRTRRHPVRVGIGVSAVLVVATAFSMNVYASNRPLVRVDSAWTLTPGEAKPKSVESGDLIDPGRWLGVVVNSKVEAFVYALSVTGGRRPEDQYAKPVPLPESLGSCLARVHGSAPIGAGRIGEWCWRASPGEEQVQLVRANDAAGEGLVVFVTTGRSLALETWFERIRRAHERSYPSCPGVPRSEIATLLPRPGEEFERGEPLSSLSEGELQQALAHFDPRYVLEGDGWRAGLGARFEGWWPIKSHR